jgi:hypothetical protein
MGGWAVPERRDDNWTHDPCSSDGHCDLRNPPDATPNIQRQERGLAPSAKPPRASSSRALTLFVRPGRTHLHRKDQRCCRPSCSGPLCTELDCEQIQMNRGVHVFAQSGIGPASPRGCIGVALMSRSANQQRANITGWIRGRHRARPLCLHAIASSKCGLGSRNDSWRACGLSAGQRHGKTIAWRTRPGIR